MEDLDQVVLVDPETDAQDHRARIKLDIPSKAAVSASRHHLTRILQDILRNSVMYSIKATPITISATVQDHVVQINVVDEGYGVREREKERVFEPFQRARQPQIFGEFGYGLSLYLCKHEIEAMNGHLWFQSEEGLGMHMSLTLPVWRASDE